MATSVIGDASGMWERLRQVEAQTKQNAEDIRDIKDNNQQAVIIERLASVTVQLEDVKKELKLLRGILGTLAALIPVGVTIVSAVQMQ